MRESQPRRRISWPLVIGVAAVGLFVIARSSPETTTIGRLARRIETIVVGLPETVQNAQRQGRERWIDARAAFHEGRAESERSLVSQLQEAKSRGSLPPV